jgi:archaeal preflagellin peptidase FlaK
LQTIIIAAKVLITIIVLLYASIKDYQSREVSNRVWAYYAPVALILSLLELSFYEPSKLPFFGLSFGVTALFALLLFYTGGFGGADSKAFMCIALALPFAPLELFAPVFACGLSPTLELIFPLTILTNSVLFAAGSGVFLLLHNYVWHKRNGKILFAGTLSKESIGKKILVLITGYRVKLEKLKEKWHIYPLEDITEEEARKLIIIPKEEGRNETVDRLSLAVEKDKIDGYVWATPGLPMLIFVTLSLFVTIFFGDLVWLFIRVVLG